MLRIRITLAVLLGLITPLTVALSPGLASARTSWSSFSGPISDEQSTTYWAYSVKAMPVRSAPLGWGRAIDSTHLYTEDGFPEDYVVLAQKVYRSRTWFKIRLPGRPNGRTGWVPEQALGRLEVTHKHVVVDERRLRLTVYVWGRKLFSAPVGIGAPSMPTPTGHYWVREKFQSTDGFYGPYAFGTADYSTLSDWPHGGVVGIHGTNEPWLIPGRPSHGCIRMRNQDISHLWPMVSVGTPVTVI